MADNDNSYVARTSHLEKRQDIVRSAVRAQAKVKQVDSQFLDTILLDLSIAGFQFYSPEQLNEFKPLMVKLPGLEMLQAKIVWRKNHYCGCQFTKPLYPAVFEHIVSKLRLAEI